MNSSCVSVLEREEMERLLDSTKSELFSEQRRFRKKLDSMQERLEEVTQELEQREEESRSLREKCSELEEKLTAAMKHRDELQQSVQSERVEQEDRLGALEKIIAQKELLLLGIQEEKSSLQMELTAIREENRAKLTAALTQAQKEKEEEVERLKVQLTQSHEHELQMVRSQGHEARAAALREQALTHTRNTESLHSCIQMKEQEVKRLQESVKQQQEVLRRREEELRGEAKEQVQKAVEREQDKFEEQMQDLERRWRADVERERRNALALQNKVVELQTRVEELESEASVQTARLRALRDEHQAELQTLHRQLKQEADSETARLKQSVKRSEKQLQGLKSALAECERVHQVAAERQERQNSGWVQDIHTECVCLQELLTHNGLSVDTKHLSHSATVSEAVQVLQSLRKPLQQLIISLQNRISSLTHTNQQISAEKAAVTPRTAIQYIDVSEPPQPQRAESLPPFSRVSSLHLGPPPCRPELELRLQRDQLTVEKERALNALKEKLIQV
ncbi:trichohyalin-like [Colossoma macropomum]|uniref:trichohyalin-like n=1 Tax=Colossoma macropomum TaxID=42526 RepID=UPI001864A3AD|nr:trichohyalin-like [Colossoma macropomum]